MLTGHHYEGSRGHTEFTNPKNKTASWVTAAGMVTWLWIVGFAWLTSNFSLARNTRGPTAEEIAFFTRRACIGTAVLLAAVIASVSICRGNRASWLRTTGCVLLGVLYGLGFVIAAIYMFL